MPSRYESLSIIDHNRTFYLRARDSVAVDFDGERYEDSTIFMRELVHRDYVRLRSVATGRYIIPIGNTLNGLAQCDRSEASGLLWWESWNVTPDGSAYVRHLASNGHYLTAQPWLGFGPRDGEWGRNVGTMSVDGKYADLMAEVPPDQYRRGPRTIPQASKNTSRATGPDTTDCRARDSNSSRTNCNCRSAPTSTSNRSGRFPGSKRCRLPPRSRIASALTTRSRTSRGPPEAGLSSVRAT